MKQPATGEIHGRERLYYLDWLRVLAVMGVFLAHIGDIFDTLYWHIRQDGTGSDWNALGIVNSQWVMGLFFLLAGASAWFALISRTGHEFVVERSKRLLIPFLIAFILLSPIQAYLMASSLADASSIHTQGNLFQFYPAFFRNMQVGRDLKWLSTYGYHLWFLAFLFLSSLLALPLLLYLKRARGMSFISRLAELCQKPSGLFVFALPVVLLQIILWAPFPGYQGWSDFFTWLLIFVYGYILVADSRFESAFRKQGKLVWMVSIGCVAVLLIANVTGALRHWENANGYSAGYLLYQLLLSITRLSLIASAFSLGIRFLNFHVKAIHYANEATLPVYIIHQPVIVLLAFFVLPWGLSPELKFVIVCAAALLVTFGLYEFLIRRIKLLRWLFGLKTAHPSQVNVDAGPQIGAAS